MLVHADLAAPTVCGGGADRERPGARSQSIDTDAWVTYWTRRAVADGIKPLIFPPSRIRAI